MSTETKTAPAVKTGKVQTVQASATEVAAATTDTNTDTTKTGEGEGDKGTGTGTGTGTGAAGAGANANTDTTKTTAVDEPNEEQLKKYFEGLGVEYKGKDDLVSKLKPAAATETQDTPEAKAERERLFEQRQIDLFTKNGGTIEQYAKLKAIANSDASEVSQAELRQELKAANFTDIQIDEIIKQQYFQVDDSELEQYEDESEKDFIKRKKEFGSKLLANRALSIKTQAGQVLSGLKAAIESEDLQVQEERQLSSKIDEHFSKVPRKITFELGSENNRKIDPIDYEVSDADIAEVRETLKDPAKRNNFLFNPEGGINLDNIANLLLRNKFLENALKTSYLTGETRTTDIFEKTYGARKATDVGVGGATQNNGTKGKVVSAGKAQRVLPQNQK